MVVLQLFIKKSGNMSGQFSGFSEADIIKLKQGDCAAVDKQHVKYAQKKNVNKISKTHTNEKNFNDSNLEIPDNARLSKLNLVESENKHDSLNDTTSQETIETKSRSPVTDSNNIIGESHLTTDLDTFQLEHKRMEEENRRRKELLCKALADRTKRTNAEAQRLEVIHQELRKLDTLLSNDVGILRNQIEDASIEFFETQKRFNKLEKEYLAARIALTNKRERKELLTQHLCTIIQQNEQRKADKLTSLMKELNLNEQA